MAQREGPAREASVLEAVREVVAETRGDGAVPAIGLDTRLEADLGLDSLAIAELLVRVEARFQVALPDHLLASVETPRDLLEHLRPEAATAGTTSEAAAPSPLSAAATVPADAATLLDVLDAHATAVPDRVHLRLLADRGQVEEMTYGALHEEATQVAAGLRNRRVQGGAAVAIMLPTGRDYFAAFFGILLAGCVPVPVYPPARPSGLEDHLRRHLRILDNAQAAALVTVARAKPLARIVAPRVPTLQHVVTVGELQAGGDRPVRARIDGSATALLQYTSGSTGDPKGVVLSHDNLLANIRAMRQAGRIGSSDVFVSWLPLYHDMGLIGSWLLSLYGGIPFVVMSPLSFLTQPARWLWAIHEHGGTLSGGPNFGYELCLRRVDDGAIEGLDLGSWRIAFNGAEPVSPRTVTRFAQRFAAYGLSRGAVTPVYGLAESAVALTVPPPGRGPIVDAVARDPLARKGRAIPAARGDPTARRVVACGPPVPGHDLRIVDAAGRALDERREGRIQFRGPSATRGYFRNHEATRRLRRGEWLDTGDLGYLADGDLYVTGRVKDLVIRAGRNLHPSEIEEAVGAVEGVRRGCVAAFPTSAADSGTERLVVVAETRIRDPEELGRLRHAAALAAADVAGTPPDEIVLAPPGAVPKTSSGKVRRTAARERYEAGRLHQRSRAVWWQLARLAVTGTAARLRRAGRLVAQTAYGAYACAVFGVTAAIVWPLIVVLPGVTRRWTVVRAAGRTVLGLTGIRVSVTGAEQLPDLPPYVLVANHASFVDPLFLVLAVREPVVFAAVGGLANNPLIRVFLRRLHAHLVQPGDRTRGLSDTEALTEITRSGKIVGFFPEGRRSPAPGLEPFHMGAFRVAADAGVPLVPVVLRGTRELLPVGRSLPWRSDVAVTVTPPRSATTGGWGGAVELRDAARGAMLDHCGEPDLA